jgi:hypothetical protein
LSKDKKFIVNKEEEKGCWSKFEINSSIDLSKLEIHQTTIIFPDSQVIVLSNFLYENDYGERDTEGKNLEIYILDHSGIIHNFDDE